MDVSGKDLINEVTNYNFIYRNPDRKDAGVKSETYRIAVLDYLRFHTNSSRYYNYSPSADGNYIGKVGKNYKELLRDWLIDKYP